MTFQVSQKFWEECLAVDAKPLDLILYSKETVAVLDRMAAKAKGSDYALSMNPAQQWVDEPAQKPWDYRRSRRH